MINTISGGPHISAIDIDHFEKRHGIKLPEDYKQFLLQRNGGRPERDIFYVPGCKASPDARIHLFCGIGHPSKTHELSWHIDLHSERLPNYLLPIASTEGADIICMDIGRIHHGRIIFWDGYELTGRTEYVVAKSFTEFIESLFRDEDSPEMHREN